MLTVRIVPGLPPYGPPALKFPDGWTRTGREGLVVEFATEKDVWTGNFARSDITWLDRAWADEDETRAYVLAGGAFWQVDPARRGAKLLFGQVTELFEVSDPPGWVVATLTEVVRIDSSGVIWETRRLSWDSFEQVRMVGNELTGLAWDLEEWRPFRIDLRTGEAVGGGF